MKYGEQVDCKSSFYGLLRLFAYHPDCCYFALIQNSNADAVFAFVTGDPRRAAEETWVRWASHLQKNIIIDRLIPTLYTAFYLPKFDVLQFSKHFIHWKYRFIVSENQLTIKKNNV